MRAAEREPAVGSADLPSVVEPDPAGNFLLWNIWPGQARTHDKLLDTITFIRYT
jgi:hypothetical protein